MSNKNFGPLNGIKVIEMGQLLAGPFVGSRLADFGAEVIKVETPGSGDPMREWGHHRYKGKSLWWPTLARNKKSSGSIEFFASLPYIFFEIVKCFSITVAPTAAAEKAAE